MSKVFVFDCNKCVGCRSCQVSCKDEHCDNDWSPIAKKQPQIGHFWCKLDVVERGVIPMVKVDNIVKLCNHCADAPCMKAAPEAVYRREDGLIVIDPEKAKGLKKLVDACPYGEIFWNEELEIPQKCTGCAHLLDNGWTVPRCVDSCVTGALQFGDEEEFAEVIKNATVLKPELGTSPSVYYLNYPKRFIGGEIYDADLDECIVGADVILTDARKVVVGTVKTDDFGDFMFDQVDAGEYTVAINARGYEKIFLKADATSKDVCFGSLAATAK